MTIPKMIEAIEKRLGQTLSSYTYPDILFFTGAGISAPDPTGFPLGNELHEIVLSTTTDLCKNEIDKVINGINAKIPLEKTNEIILKYFNKSSDEEYNQLLNLLTDICIYAPDLNREEDWKQPNDYHQYFSKHLYNKGRHITANLDQFIELEPGFHYYGLQTSWKLEDLHGKISNKVIFPEGILFKFHGDPNIDAYGKQGFFESVLNNGFSTTVKNMLDSGIQQSKLVIFIGYGGWDDFDMNPYFSEKSPSFFSNTNAIWIRHFEADMVVKDGKDNTVPPNIAAILNSFQKSVLLEGKSDEYREILNTLFPNLPQIVNTHRTAYRDQYKIIFDKSIKEHIKIYTQYRNYRYELGEEFRNLIYGSPRRLRSYLRKILATVARRFRT